MKKLTTIIAFFISLSCFSQTEKPIPDSVKYISNQHIQKAYKIVTEQIDKAESTLTLAQYKAMMNAMELLYQNVVKIAGDEYKKKPK